MAYCSKCGTKNEDDAEFCKKCGNSLTKKPTKKQDDWEKNCENECSGGHKGWGIFWGIVIIVIGIWIIFEIVLKELAKTIPELSWVNNYSFQPIWIIFAALALLIIMAGIRIIMKNR
jgi:hypothetical protein